MVHRSIAGIMLISTIAVASLSAEVRQEDSFSVRTSHPSVCTDYTQGKVFIVLRDGKAARDYDSKGRVVWTFGDHRILKTVSSIPLPDVPGNAIQFEIFH